MTHTNKFPCCPKFDTKPWDNKTHKWKDKLFIQDNVRQIFHTPINIGPVITRMWNKAQVAGATPEIKDFLLLAYDPSPWTSELYMTVTKEVPNAKNVKLSGTFISKVFDGPYNAVPKWLKEMEKYLSDNGKTAKRYFFYFTTCPKCAEYYGHNYVVAFAEV
ncbi:MAG: hypothetical protein GYA51_15220 [Candidatus Methanofastidiosa archaeon]|nr:hypothetical protein [Candidatus Methanofastidiosa archaeon]